MKFGIKLSNIQLGEVKIGGVEINTEFSINEMVAMRKEAEHVLENAPMYFDELGEAYLAGYNVYKTIEQYESEKNQQSHEEPEHIAFTEEDLKNIILQRALNHLRK